ncbi:nitrilase [Moelleriella libera RCEF 2490]|uniref:Nitrilase n=1 Tax=Moelleriella libera RCEF 2490 TaxID=1081109 RepID=A0A168EEC1_9HYPO|nr:nitrilase [Moelleriella libera RCEF 2490]
MQVLFLPEAADYISLTASESLSLAQPQSTSPFVLGLCSAAKAHACGIHVGIHEPISDSSSSISSSNKDGGKTKKLFNRVIYITPEGHVQASASYDKMHVFDYGSLRESATVEPGTRLTPPFETPVGVIGSLICFDLRFPEAAVALAAQRPPPALYNKMTPCRDASSSSCGESAVTAAETAGETWKSAQIITYPSAFTIRTGRAHWETLLRARAIEAQAWVVASAQVGRHNDKRASYGNSLVVDPWGKVRLRLGGVLWDKGGGDGGGSVGEAEPGAVGQIGFVELDMDMLERVRREMPLVRRLL